ncbi:MAG: sporulation histidine kinase inhibitor Sda [Bacillus sp. (in: Bacteria)]|nr:sporulation histidine kinase inhibitor Sda [Bacillus sp. (in: firmicutes)]
MHKLTDEMLLEVYTLSNELGLSEEFVVLVMEELQRRQLHPNNIAY